MNKLANIVLRSAQWSAVFVLLIALTLGAQLIGAVLFLGKWATAVQILKSLYQ